MPPIDKRAFIYLWITAAVAFWLGKIHSAFFSLSPVLAATYFKKFSFYLTRSKMVVAAEDGRGLDFHLSNRFFKTLLSYQRCNYLYNQVKRTEWAKRAKQAKRVKQVRWKECKYFLLPFYYGTFGFEFRTGLMGSNFDGFELWWVR